MIIIFQCGYKPEGTTLTTPESSIMVIGTKTQGINMPTDGPKGHDLPNLLLSSSISG